MSREPKVIAPLDQRGIPIHRAMGMPIVVRDRYLSSSSDWAILYDLSAEKYLSRVFQGLSVENTSQTSRIILAWVDNLMDTPIETLDIGTQQFLTLDLMQFGPGIIDDSEEKRVRYILGKLDVAQGTQASGTINYSVSGNPSDGEEIEIAGYTIEFSSDASKSPSADLLIPILASADLTWSALVTEFNAFQRQVRLSINTGTDLVTVTALIGGTTGNAIEIADVSTGAVFSGATLASGAGGVLPYCHIW